MLEHLPPSRGLLAVAACSLALAACGASDTGDSTGSESANDQDAAQVRLQECLRENGVDIPGGGGPGALGDVDRDDLDKAMEACEELQQEAFGDITEGDQQELQDAATKFTQCMRDEGVDVPDINIGEGPPEGGGGEIDQDDPEVQAALEKCQDELPQGAGPGAP